MAIKNIQMNILNSSSGYDILYPESDYTLMKNKPSIPDVSVIDGLVESVGNLNGLKMEKGQRQGTGVSELNNNEITLCTLQKITNPVLFLCWRSIFAGLYLYDKITYKGSETSTQVSGYTQSTSATGGENLIYFSPFRPNQANKRFGVYNLFEGHAVYVSFTFKSSSITVVGRIGYGDNYTFNKGIYNNSDGEYHWWCLGY